MNNNNNNEERTKVLIESLKNQMDEVNFKYLHQVYERENIHKRKRIFKWFKEDTTMKFKKEMISHFKEKFNKKYSKRNGISKSFYNRKLKEYINYLFYCEMDSSSDDELILIEFQ